ncbi:MAG: hypothetical protein AAFN92_11025 [Bacteroidota bacterium]
MQYTPQLGDLYLTMALTGAAFLALVFLAFRLNKLKHPDPRRRVLLPMLAYFAALLALMVSLGSLWSVFKYPTVEVTATELKIGNTKYPRPNPQDLRLENYTGSGLGPATKVLLVQTKDRRTWAFPEDRYPVNEMLGKLRER